MALILIFLNLLFVINKDPEGYKKLLVYQKAKVLHSDTLELVQYFPHTKTYADLADQMARSGRSGNKNIVEGWKRNTTKKYFNFLGFCIGAVEELKDDAEDIVLGVYPELMELKEIMGEKGIQRVKERAKRGEKGLMLLTELEILKFYPLDASLPPIIKLYLKAKEINFLLDKLQRSLNAKMDTEHTKTAHERFKSSFEREKQADKEFSEYLKSLGLRRLENGQLVDDDKE